VGRTPLDLPGRSDRRRTVDPIPEVGQVPGDHGAERHGHGHRGRRRRAGPTADVDHGGRRQQEQHGGDGAHVAIDRHPEAGTDHERCHGVHRQVDVPTSTGGEGHPDRGGCEEDHGGHPPGPGVTEHLRSADRRQLQSDHFEQVVDVVAAVPPQVRDRGPVIARDHRRRQEELQAAHHRRGHQVGRSEHRHGPRRGACTRQDHHLRHGDRRHHRQALPSNRERRRCPETQPHGPPGGQDGPSLDRPVEGHQGTRHDRHEGPLGLQELRPPDEERRKRDGGGPGQSRHHPDPATGQEVPAARERCGADDRHRRQTVDVGPPQGHERSQDEGESPRVQRWAERRSVRHQHGELVLGEDAPRVPGDETIGLAQVQRPVVTPPVAGPVGGEHQRRHRPDEQRDGERFGEPPSVSPRCRTAGHRRHRARAR
jgi:hypothetical protein